jgi:hypothetical protein
LTLHIMSDKELTRLEVLRDLTTGRLTVSAATEFLGLERRQVLRLSKAYQEEGVTALVSKKRRAHAGCPKCRPAKTSPSF